MKEKKKEGSYMNTYFPEYYLKQSAIVKEVEKVLAQSCEDRVIGLEGGACRSKWSLLKKVAKKMDKGYLRISKNDKNEYLLRELWNEHHSTNGYILHLESIDYRTLNGTYDLIKGLNLTNYTIIQTTNTGESTMKLCIYE